MPKRILNLSIGPNQEVSPYGEPSLSRWSIIAKSRMMAVLLSLNTAQAACRPAQDTHSPVSQPEAAEAAEGVEKIEEELGDAEISHLKKLLMVYGDRYDVKKLEGFADGNKIHDEEADLILDLIESKDLDSENALLFLMHQSDQRDLYRETFYQAVSIGRTAFNHPLVDKIYKTDPEFRDFVYQGLQSGAISIPPMAAYEEFSSEEWFKKITLALPMYRATVPRKKTRSVQDVEIKFFPDSVYQTMIDDGSLRSLLGGSPWYTYWLPDSVFLKLESESWFSEILDGLIGGDGNALAYMPEEFASNYYNRLAPEHKKKLRKRCCAHDPVESLFLPPEAALDAWKEGKKDILKWTALDVWRSIRPLTFFKLWNEAEGFQEAFKSRLSDVSQIFLLEAEIFAFFWNQEEFRTPALAKLEKHPNWITYIDANYIDAHHSEPWVTKAIDQLVAENLKLFVGYYIQFDWAAEKARKAIEAHPEDHPELAFILTHGKEITDEDERYKMTNQMIEDHPLQSFFFVDSINRKLHFALAKKMTSQERALAFMLDPEKAKRLFGDGAEENYQAICATDPDSLERCVDRIPKNILAQSTLILGSAERLERHLSNPDFIAKFAENYPYIAFRHCDKLKDQPQVIEKALKKGRAEFAIMNADRLIEHFGQLGVKWVTEAVERQPIYGLLYLRLFKDHEPMVASLRDILLRGYPDLKLEAIHLWKNVLIFPDGPEIMEQLLADIVKDDGRELPILARRFYDKPWAQKIVKKSGIKIEKRGKEKRMTEAELMAGVESGSLDHEFLLDHVDLVKDLNWLKKELEKALSSHKNSILRKAGSIPESLREDLVRQAAQGNAKGVLTYCGRFARNSWALPLIDSAFRSFEANEGDWALEFPEELDLDSINRCRTIAKRAQSKKDTALVEENQVESVADQNSYNFWLNKLSNKEEDLNYFFDHFFEEERSSITPEQAKNMVDQAFSINPDLTLSRLPSFVEQEWAGDLIESWVNLSTAYQIMTEVNQFAGKVDDEKAKKIIGLIADMNMAIFMENYYKIPGGLADDLWLKAAESKPQLAFIYFPGIPKSRQEAREKTLSIIEASVDLKKVESELSFLGRGFREIFDEAPELERVYLKKLALNGR